MNAPTVIHDTFRIERTYPHAPAKVFRAFSDPALKRRWMGGEREGWEVDRFEMAFEEGGREQWRFRFQGGETISNEVLYLDIVPQQRIVIAYTMAMAGKRFSSSHQTIELRPEGDGTRLVLTEHIAFLDGSNSTRQREHGTSELLGALGRELDGGR